MTKRLLLVLLAVTTSCIASKASESSANLRQIAFDVSSGTWMTVDIAPDGKTLVFDLLGNIYELPIAGGAARALTSGRAWNRAPQYSPDGRAIAMVRDGAGPDEVWTMPASGGEPRPITNHSTKREGWVGGTPSWAPDGRSIVYGEFDTEQNPPLYRIDVATKRVTQLITDTLAGSHRSGVLSPDGKHLFFSDRRPDGWGAGVFRGEGPFNAVVRIDLATGARTVLTDRTAGLHEYTPRLTRDGRWLAYVRRDRTGRSALRVRQLDSDGNVVAGSDREFVTLADEDEPYRWDDTDERPAYAFTPDGSHIVIGSAGKIHTVSVVNGADRIIPFTVRVERPVPPLAQARTSLPDGPIEVHGVQWPRLTPDGKTLVFGAVGYLWVQTLPDGEPKRLTHSGDDVFEFTPALSPDGKTVAYTQLARMGIGVTPGRLVTLPLGGAGAEPTMALADAVTLLAPSWSPDGSKLAFIRDDGARSSFGWVALGDHVPHVVAPVEAAQRETWGRLVFFSKDGKRLFLSREYDIRGGIPDSTSLTSVDLEGRDARLLAMGGSETRGMVPSPDGRNVLTMGVDDDLWLHGLSHDSSPVRFDLADPDVSRITGTGAEFVDWRSDSAFIYSYGNKIYGYTIGGGAPALMHTVHLTVPRHQGHGTVAFTNARIITVNGDHGAGEVIERGTLVMRDRRIDAVGASDRVAVPQGARVIDATGLTLMPAIGDMHYHSQGGTNLLAKMVFPNGELGLPVSIPYGITMGWQPGGPTRQSGGLDLAEAQQAGRVPGPRWINAPWGVNMATYGDNSPRVLSTYADALRSTHHRADLGATVLKEYETRRRDQRQWYGDAARQVGVGIVSHVQGLDQALSRAADGYTGFDHPAFAVPVYDDVRQFLARTGTIWTPNFNITWGTTGSAADAERAFVREVLKHWPDQSAKWAYYYPKRALDSLPPKVPWDSTQVGREAKAAAYLMAGGVKIGISAHNPPPLFALGEMWHLQQAGAPRGEVIRMGTMVGAEKMGLARELGSLDPGKIADILVLRGNPLDDIVNIVATKYVVADGVVYDVMPATGSASHFQ